MTDDLVETGLAGLTAAVTNEYVPRPPHICASTTGTRCDICFGEVPPAAPAYRKAPLPDGWNLHKVAALVRDIAQSMYDLPVILAKHGLSEPQYRLLADNEFFKSALQQFTIDWNSAANTQKRLALEAAISLEAALPDVVARAHKPTEPLADVVQLVKVLAEIAGTIGPKAAMQPVAPSEKFKIVINLGGDTFQHSTMEVQSLPEGPGPERPVQALLEATGVPTTIRLDTPGS